MKFTSVLTLILLTTRLWSQGLDSLGVGDDKTLTRQEYRFLNQDFSDKRDDFDFKDKKIAYVGGTSGNYFWSKKDYFDIYAKPRVGTDRKGNSSLIILTKEEKEKSGGYDAFILTPVKIFTDRHRERVVKRLRTKK